MSEETLCDMMSDCYEKVRMYEHTSPPQPLQCVLLCLRHWHTLRLRLTTSSPIVTIHIIEYTQCTYVCIFYYNYIPLMVYVSRAIAPRAKVSPMTTNISGQQFTQKHKLCTHVQHHVHTCVCAHVQYKFYTGRIASRGKYNITITALKLN